MRIAAHRLFKLATIAIIEPHVASFLAEIPCDSSSAGGDHVR